MTTERADLAPGRAARALRGAAAAGAATLAAVSAHNTYRVLRLRTEADRHDHDLVHDGLVGAAGGRPLRLTVLGDSTATGFGLTDPHLAYPRRLATGLSEALGRPVALRCHARRGARIRDVTEHQVPKLAAQPPDLVVVSVGANDALGRRLPFQVRADTAVLLDALRVAAPGARLFLGGAPDLGDAPALPAPLDGIVSLASRWVARAQGAVAAGAGVAFAVLESGQPPDKFGPDGFHGGPAFHAEAARMTVEVLLEGPLAALSA